MEDLRNGAGFDFSWLRIDVKWGLIGNSCLAGFRIGWCVVSMFSRLKLKKKFTNVMGTSISANCMLSCLGSSGV